MEQTIAHNDPVLLIGEGDLAASVAVCLLRAGHQLDVCTPKQQSFNGLFKMHVSALERNNSTSCNVQNLRILSDIPETGEYKLIVILTPENINVKLQWISRIQQLVGKDTVVAINTESIGINELNDQSLAGNALIGLNWTEPAHTTFFLEIVSGKDTEAAEQVSLLAKSYWGKDPYIVKDFGIRSRLISAMAREASFLVDNGYASVDDIDRACRNDAGYYLPFAGNCRYMDLMGTYAYGMVMKDLNPDLSKDKELPRFFKEIMEAGGLGMENGKGFYNYTEAEVENWRRTMEDFSFQIQAIIEKYPFNYNKEPFTD